ncbi:tetratricopeptide repeat protein [Methanobrevibacter sp.]|uniref:tetratricopeptide repeat protein n=1 Tax=Methanobrevibacter sp. TaxID=66852 RepID=UPI00386C6D78
MGILDKVFNRKSDEKAKREVGDSFDKNDADEIFDMLDKLDTKEAKKLSKNMQKEVDLTKEVSNLLKEAKKTNSIELFEKVLVLQPENAEAYEGLANIYRNNGDADNEIKVLKMAVQKIDGNNKIKNKLMQRLKELN